MNVVNEQDVIISGDTYKQITYDNGKIELKQFDEEFKMWVVLRCVANEVESQQNTKELENTIKSIHISQYKRGAIH